MFISMKDFIKYLLFINYTETLIIIYFFPFTALIRSSKSQKHWGIS